MRPVNYDTLAATYDRRYEEYAYDGVERSVSCFVSSSEVARSVLEVRCGTGHWLAKLEGRGLPLSGLDPSLEMLRLARTRLPMADLRSGHAELIPWEAATFDRVMCINALHHFDGKKEFVAEALRVLKGEGGLMVVGLDPHTGLDRWSIYDYFKPTKQQDMRSYPPTSQIRQWMREAGFSRCRTSEAHRILLRLPARESIEQGRLEKATTSQLALLTAAEYEQGMNRLWKAIRIREASGDRLELIADLRLYATIGWLPGHPGVDCGSHGNHRNRVQRCA